MKYIKNKLEILFWKFARYLIVKGYGAECPTSDLDDFHEMYSKAPLSQSVTAEGRCASCRAKETVKWIDAHIALVKFFE